MRTVTTSRRFAAAAVLLLATVAVLCLPSSASPKHEEKPYALIVCTIWAPNDLPAYGVKVKIRRADQDKPKWEGQSDHHGEVAVRVPAGEADYVLEAEVKTKDGKKAEAKVHVTYDEQVDVSLHLTE
jgi:hypothetical protein